MKVKHGLIGVDYSMKELKIYDLPRETCCSQALILHLTNLRSNIFCMTLCGTWVWLGHGKHAVVVSYHGTVRC